MTTHATPSGDNSAALEAEAGRIVSEVLGRRGLHGQAIRRGVMTFKCVVRTADPVNFVVRFYPVGREGVVDCEPDLWSRCRAAGLPVPRVLVDSRTGPRARLAYVAYEYIEGETLAAHLPRLASEQQVKLAADLARWIHVFPRVEFRKYGELLNGTTASDSSWVVFVGRSLRVGLQALAQHGLLDKPFVHQVRTAAARAGDLVRSTPSSLVWGDINFENVLVDERGRVVGFIDFESCLSGDPLATLGYCFAAHGDHTFCDTFLKAWPAALSARDLDRVMLYAVLRALRLAPYAHQPLPTGHPRDPLVDIFPGLALAVSKLAAGQAPAGRRDEP